MKVHQMKPITPGNPFTSDLYHVGEFIEDNVCVMWTSTRDRKAPYIIVVNRETGERVRVDFTEVEDRHHNVAAMMGGPLD
jgi:hypothetical protein